MLNMNMTQARSGTFAVVLGALAAFALTGCNTAGSSENLSAAKCEELREEKRSRQDDNLLSSQDIEDLRVQGC